MRPIEYILKLEEVVRGLPPAALSLFSEDDPAMKVRKIGVAYNLINRDIGEMCEMVRQVIAREMPPENFRAALEEKLSDDGREKLEDVMNDLNGQIFAKLLPALGIKVPLEMAIKPKPAVVEQAAAQVAPAAAAKSAEPPQPAPIVPQHPLATASEPPRVVPFRKIPPLHPGEPRFSVHTPPLHQTYQEPVNVMPNITAQPRPKPPIMETSHEKMSDQPLESLMKMLEGVVTETALARQFEKLPYSLKNALRSVDSAKKVVDIGRKYALHVDKLGELGAETGMVLLGFSHPAQFLNRLTRHLDLPEEKIRLIADEINSEVFLKVREALKEMNGEVVKTQPPPAPSRETPASPTQKLAQNTVPDNLPTGELLNPESETMLSREEILQGIEHPTPIQAESETQASSKPEGEAKQEPKEETAAIIAPPAPQTAPVMPQPPLSPDNFQLKSAPAPVLDRQTKEIPAPPMPPTPASLPKPAEIQASQPENPKPQKSIADQKLSATTASAKSERTYSADPYREPIE